MPLTNESHDEEYFCYRQLLEIEISLKTISMAMFAAGNDKISDLLSDLSDRIGQIQKRLQEISSEKLSRSVQSSYDLIGTILKTSLEK